MSTEDRAVAFVNWALTHYVAILVGLAAVVVTAFLIALLAELRKKHISKKTEDKVEGWVIQKTLAGSALLFGGLEYLIPFIQNNLAVLQSLKFVGGYVVAVFAAANFLYAFKFKKWFKTFETALEARRDKLAAKKAANDAPQPDLSQPLPSTPENGVVSPFDPIA